MVAPEVDAPMEMDQQAPEKSERFKAITLASLDEWGEKFPRLKPKLQDIRMSAMIFPFKASPYLVEELIDWEMEGRFGFHQLDYHTCIDSKKDLKN